MKKLGILSIVLCIMFCLSVFGQSVVAFAIANSTDVTDTAVLAKFAEGASAVIVDKDGNVIEDLDIEVSVTRDTEPRRNAGTTYTVTYTARVTKTNSDATAHPDGVTASGTITWNDILGTTNSLVSVSGYWAVGDESISNRVVTYGAMNTEGATTVTLTKYPTANAFGYSPVNCTGFVFYLNMSAKIDATGNTVWLRVVTTMFA